MTAFEPVDGDVGGDAIRLDSRIYRRASDDIQRVVMADVRRRVSDHVDHNVIGPVFDAMREGVNSPPLLSHRYHPSTVIDAHRVIANHNQGSD